MRLAPVLLVVAACSGGGADEGALLTFVAPDGMIANRLEVVLASADGEAITKLDNQRVRPGALASEDVVYYRQRASGGAIEKLDGLATLDLLILPNADVATDEEFIPFVLVYDRDALVGVGTVRAPDDSPMPVKIAQHTLTRHDVVIEPVVAVETEDRELGVSEGRLVSCYDAHQDPWTSGLVWRPASGPQLRLLLPDLAADDKATDASRRPADLDCDQHDAVVGDCDDLRVRYNTSAIEACDGLDTDCDGRMTELVESCPLTDLAACGGTGVAYCMEAGVGSNPGSPPIQSICQPAAACACALATGGSVPPYGCNRCVIAALDGDPDRELCAPAVGKLYTQAGCTPDTPCTVSVVHVDGPFEVKISAAERGPFAFTTPITSTSFYLRATHTAGGTTTAMPRASVGEVYLAITTVSGFVPMAVDLQLDGEVDVECPPSPTDPDVPWMSCTP